MCFSWIICGHRSPLSSSPLILPASTCLHEQGYFHVKVELIKVHDDSHDYIDIHLDHCDGQLVDNNVYMIQVDMYPSLTNCKSYSIEDSDFLPRTNPNHFRESSSIALDCWRGFFSPSFLFGKYTNPMDRTIGLVIWCSHRFVLGSSFENILFFYSIDVGKNGLRWNKASWGILN